MRMVKVIERRKEAKDTESIYFEGCSEALPGQFIMVWLPGIDEFPMSLSRIGRISSITVLKKGAGTEALMSADEFSIRGPFGNGFSLCRGKEKDREREKILIAGGIGMASLLPIVARDDIVFLGAKSKDYLPFVDEMRARGADVRIATDDGSCGFKGSVIDLIESLPGHLCSEQIYACGPMEMLRSLYEQGIDAEASLESYMKCAIGICDSCTINGFIVCREGPVVKLDRIFGSR
ncbi:MAG: dihydroorotate dehydrogenase electron transfer subunit [Candidatus Thermoplasmatota archaeon]|nr:dihydroorotate dehydrogenase electron transfer subunit [Candidatus Thermoplasmatota archaeon]